MSDTRTEFEVKTHLDAATGLPVSVMVVREPAKRPQRRILEGRLVVRRAAASSGSSMSEISADGRGDRSHVLDCDVCVRGTRLPPL
jgi:hypothetical protein